MSLFELSFWFFTYSFSQFIVVSRPSISVEILKYNIFEAYFTQILLKVLPSHFFCFIILSTCCNKWYSHIIVVVYSSCMFISLNWVNSIFVSSSITFHNIFCVFSITFLNMFSVCVCVCECVIFMYRIHTGILIREKVRVMYDDEVCYSCRGKCSSLKDYLK